MKLRKEIIRKEGGMTALTRNEIITAIEKAKNLRDQALISFLYLTGARIEEVVKYKDLKNKTTKSPLLLHQIEKISDTEYNVNNVRCLKLRTTKKKRIIPLIKRFRELYFFEKFESYISTIKNPETKLWDLTRQRVHQILQEVSLFPHLLRHSRITHLVVDYLYGVSDLQKFAGWSRGDTATSYVHLSVEDLKNKLRQN